MANRPLAYTLTERKVTVGKFTGKTVLQAYPMGRKSATPKVTRKQAVKLKNAQKNMRINESLEAVSDGTRQTISKTAGSRTQRATQKSN